MLDQPDHFSSPPDVKEEKMGWCRQTIQFHNPRECGMSLPGLESRLGVHTGGGRWLEHQSITELERLHPVYSSRPSVIIQTLIYQHFGVHQIELVFPHSYFTYLNIQLSEWFSYRSQGVCMIKGL